MIFIDEKCLSRLFIVHNIAHIKKSELISILKQTTYWKNHSFKDKFLFNFDENLRTSMHIYIRINIKPILELLKQGIKLHKSMQLRNRVLTGSFFSGFWLETGGPGIITGVQLDTGGFCIISGL